MKKPIEEKRLEQTAEIIDFIKEANLTDVFTETNKFYEKYGVNLYSYIRVSTEEQDFGRQLIELHNWCKQKEITLPIENIFFDKYTGKKTDRGGYQNLKLKIGSSDYLIVSELNRLGRNWENTKDEWEDIQKKNINVIIQDNEMLSAPLPNEDRPVRTLEYKFIQSIIFSAINYVASKKIEEVSRTTKDGLKKARLRGKQIGRPLSKNANIKNFMETLRLQIEEKKSIAHALKKTKFPRATYFDWMKKYKEENGLKTKEEIYKFIKLKTL